MVIVVGACGFIGFYLVRHLLNLGYSVLAADRTVSEEARFLMDAGAKFVELDITDEEDFDLLPHSGVRALVNLACVQPANASTTDFSPPNYISVNVLGVAHCLEYCRHNKVDKVIHTISHRSVQGLWERGEKIREDAIRAIKYSGKFAMFSISESAAADLIEYYIQQHGLNAVLFRLPSVYGFGHHINVLAGPKLAKTGLSAFIENAKAGKDIEIWGDPDKGRDVIYVKDVVRAVEMAIRNEETSGAFNIATGKALTLRDQVKSVIKVFANPQKPSNVIFRSDKPNSIDSCTYDVSKAKDLLGWEPIYSFEDMLRDYKSESETGALNFLLDRKSRMAAEVAAESTTNARKGG